MNKIKESYCFDDVLLVPLYSDIKSRSDIDLSSHLNKEHKNLKLKLPIISSPMDTVTEDSMSAEMSRLGGLGIIHRYGSISNQALLVRSSARSGAKNIGAAVGVTGDFIDRACACVDSGANIICVDIAHGHHVLMKTSNTRT